MGDALRHGQGIWSSDGDRRSVFGMVKTHPFSRAVLEHNRPIARLLSRGL